MKLKEYLYRNDTTIRAFAKTIGVNYNLLGHIRSGKKTPSVKLAIKIILASKGIITPQDLIPKLFEAYELARQKTEMENKD